MADDEKDALPPDEAAEDGTEDGNSASGRKRFHGRKLALLVALPLLLVSGAGAGAYYSGALDSYVGTDNGKKEEKKADEAKPAIFYDLPDLLVNLNSSGDRSNYLKISISLELRHSQDIDHIKAVMPRIIDNFQVYLRELRVEDLRGSAGLARLREQLLRRINVAAAPTKVADVLFREMLVQ